MTDVQETNDPLPDRPRAIVEAFIDGEPVLPEALKDVLAEPAAREYLADLLVLRAAVAMMAPASSGIARHDRRSNRMGWLAAAAAVLISLAAGFLAGQRVVTPVEARTVEAVVEFQSAPTAPTPTRIITLRPGVNWTESSGGR